MVDLCEDNAEYVALKENYQYIKENFPQYGYCMDEDTFYDFKIRIDLVLGKIKRFTLLKNLNVEDKIIKDLGVYLPESREEFIAIPGYNLSSHFKKVEN